MDMKGMKTAVEALRLEDYPIDRSGIDYSVGDIEVEDGGGGWVAIRDLTDRLDHEEFRSAEEVIHSLRDCIERRRRQAA